MNCLQLNTNLFNFVINISQMLERIKRFIETQNMSSSAFANAIGVQRSSVSHILSGRNKPSLDFVLRLKKHYPELNLDWLLFGKGPILMTKKSSEEDSTNSEKSDISHIEKPIATPEPKNLFDEITNQPNEKLERIEEEKPILEKKGSNFFGLDNKSIKKIILLYEDNSFEEYNPLK